MNEENPSYYAIIPANVRYSDITPNAKLLYGEITALCNKTGCCYATNDYFSKLYNVSKISVSKWVKELAENGFIETDMNYKEGTKEILNRYIRIVYDPIKEKFNTPIKEKFKDNITSNNITSNKKEIYKEKFEEFWKIYTPVKCNGKFIDKGSKKTAEEKFIKILEKGEEYESIINGCKEYIEHCRENNQLTCGVTVFLNQERWKGDYSGNACKESDIGERQKTRSIVETYAEIASELAEKDNLW